jgi:hypothetical protein
MARRALATRTNSARRFRQPFKILALGDLADLIPHLLLVDLNRFSSALLTATGNPVPEIQKREPVSPVCGKGGDGGN